MSALPPFVKWTVHALGASRSPYGMTVRDPVAAWLVAKHDHLIEAAPSSTIASMIRSRTALIDQLVEEELHKRGHPVAYISIAGGFDCRWARIADWWSHVKVHREVERAEVLDLKDRLLSGSMLFRDLWERIEVVPHDDETWLDALPPRGQDVLLVMEGLVGRYEEQRLADLLRRLSATLGKGTVILDVPEGWSLGFVKSLGWDVCQWWHLGPRFTLLGSQGEELVAGVQGIQAVVLQAPYEEPGEAVMIPEEGEDAAIWSTQAAATGDIDPKT